MENNGWSYDLDTGSITINAGTTVTFTGNTCEANIINNGTISDGKFLISKNGFVNNGTIENGEFNLAEYWSFHNNETGIINNGNFNITEQTNATVTIYMLSSGVINNGTFKNQENSNYQELVVKDSGVINGGTFYCIVSTDPDTKINGGTYYEVTNRGTIRDSVFYCLDNVNGGKVYNSTIFANENSFYNLFQNWSNSKDNPPYGAYTENCIIESQVLIGANYNNDFTDTVKNCTFSDHIDLKTNGLIDGGVMKLGSYFFTCVDDNNMPSGTVKNLECETAFNLPSGVTITDKPAKFMFNETYTLHLSGQKIKNLYNSNPKNSHTSGGKFSTAHNLVYDSDNNTITFTVRGPVNLNAELDTDAPETSATTASTPDDVNPPVENPDPPEESSKPVPTDVEPPVPPAPVTTPPTTNNSVVVTYTYIPTGTPKTESVDLGAGVNDYTSSPASIVIVLITASAGLLAVLAKKRANKLK